MATVPVTLIGVVYTDKTGNAPHPVTIVAEMHTTGLSVGGGPMPGGPQPPLGIWGGPFDPPHAEHPIYWPPGTQPHPDHSLPLPQPPTGPADENGFVKPPPPGGGWSYHEDYGWMYSPGGQTPGPKTQPA
jgi:hypothetical protein